MARTLEQRLRRLEEMVSEIHTLFVMGKEEVTPGARQYEQAIKDLLAGDTRTLDLYVRRGGKPMKMNV